MTIYIAAFNFVFHLKKFIFCTIAINFRLNKLYQFFFSEYKLDEVFKNLNKKLEHNWS